MQYSCSSGHVTTLGGEVKSVDDDDSGCGDDSASSYASNSGPATELSDTSLIAADLSKEATTVANNGKYRLKSY